MAISFRATTGLIFLPMYFAISILIGWVVRRRNDGANAYLNASRSLPLWVVSAAYLAANCGALEIVGLSAMAAQYGVSAMHFYLIGAIPAMIFLAIWMMPVYRRSGVRSVPEYLEQRYGPGVRLLNACVMAIIMLLLAGVSLYAMAQVLQVFAGINFVASVILSAGIVMAYVLLGGVRATIYNEVFQLFVMLAGLVPLACKSARLMGAHANATARDHLWVGVPAISTKSTFDGFGLVFGLGFVLSFGYWCTDFVQMQRAFAARTEGEARQVPLLAGLGKMLFALVVVVPGLAAFRLLPQLGHAQRFDQALPILMTTLYGPILLGLGLSALVASLMSSLAANVSAFAAIWTEDIYRATWITERSDAHYLRVGKVAVVAAILISVASSYLNFLFNSLIEHVQLIFSIFGAPFWAIFLLGMATRRATARGVVLGFVAGTAVALLHLLAVTFGWLSYGSVMSGNFYAAGYSFLTTLCVSWLASLALRAESDKTNATGLVFCWQTGMRGEGIRLLWALSAALLTVFALLNYMWR